jgi:hypothetical protein
MPTSQPLSTPPTSGPNYTNSVVGSSVQHSDSDLFHVGTWLTKEQQEGDDSRGDEVKGLWLNCFQRADDV